MCVMYADTQKDVSSSRISPPCLKKSSCCAGVGSALCSCTYSCSCFVLHFLEGARPYFDLVLFLKFFTKSGRTTLLHFNGKRTQKVTQREQKKLSFFLCHPLKAVCFPFFFAIILLLLTSRHCRREDISKH